MRLLGISTLGHSAAVALVDEHNVLFAIEEEKLSRLRDTSEIPRLALDRCLRENRIELSDCRAIALAERTAGNARSRKRRKRPERSAAQQQLHELLHGGPRPIHFDHHLCHAASAYYTSGFDRALIFSLDEGALSQSGLIALGDGDEIRPLQLMRFPDSFGWFYSRITEVAGLNPHSGEGGTLGDEDLAVVAPAVARLRADGIDARGPLPADSMFHAAARATYDVALCMYHDQALVPIKALAFDHAVNVTLGLPFVRTSPDHGTAFDIAGSGSADPSSLIAALRLAARLAANPPA